MKLKNKFLLFLSFASILLLSSCNQEEGKLILSQYNYSYLQKFEIENKLTFKNTQNEALYLSDFNEGKSILSQSSLSYGASFTNNDIKINQIKIFNDLFNWTFSPNIFEDDGVKYFGAKNLIIPNNMMLGNLLNCEIFLEDGTIIKDSIETQNASFDILNLDISILDDFLLISNFSSKLHSINKNLFEVDYRKYLTFEESFDSKVFDESDDNDFIIKFYSKNKLLYEKEFKLNLNEDYYLFKSEYVRTCDSIYIAKKTSNNSLSCKEYSIIK